MSNDDIEQRAKTQGERLRHLLHFAGDGEIADAIEYAASVAHKTAHGEPLPLAEYTTLCTLAAILRMRKSEKTLAGLRAGKKEFTDQLLRERRYLLLTVEVTDKSPPEDGWTSAAGPLYAALEGVGFFLTHCEDKPERLELARTIAEELIDEAITEGRIVKPLTEPCSPEARAIGCICSSSTNYPPPAAECPVHGDPKPLTPEEAEKAYEAAVPIPISEERLAEIVEYATGTPTAEDLARFFHETYERLAPSYGYETRKDSAKPWSEVPEKNRKLMVGVCRAVIARYTAIREAVSEEMQRDALKKLAVEQTRRLLDDHLEKLRRFYAPKLRVPDSRDALDNIGMDTRDVAIMFASTIKRAAGAPPLLQEIVSAIENALRYVLGIPPYVNRNTRVEVAEEDAWSMNAALPAFCPACKKELTRDGYCPTCRTEREERKPR